MEGTGQDQAKGHRLRQRKGITRSKVNPVEPYSYPLRRIKEGAGVFFALYVYVKQFIWDQIFFGDLRFNPTQHQQYQHRTIWWQLARVSTADNSSVSV